MALALIDETGDPGTGGAGRVWFCWIALVIPDERINDARTLRDELACKVRGQGAAVSPKEWDKHISGDNLIGTFRGLQSLDGWVWVAVASYTPLSTPATASHIHSPTEHRYYTLLCLLERVSWIGEVWGERVTVVVERPNDQDFNQSMLCARHLSGLPHSKVNYEFLPADMISVVAPTKEPLLNLAHCVALGFGKALNAHELWGATFTEYIEIVRDNLWVGPKKDGSNGLIDIGITLLPYNHRFGLEGELPFVRKWWVEHFAEVLGRS